MKYLLYMEDTLNPQPTIPVQEPAAPQVSNISQASPPENKNSHVLKIIMGITCLALGGSQIILSISLFLFVVPQVKGLQESLEITQQPITFYLAYASLAITAFLGLVNLFLGYMLLRQKINVKKALMLFAIIWVIQGVMIGLIITSIITPIYKTISAVDSNLVTTSPTQSPTMIKEWQLYRNEQYGYEVQFPRNWTVNDATDETTIPLNPDFKPELWGNEIHRISIASSEDWQLNFTIAVEPNTRNQTLKDFAEILTAPDSDGKQIARVRDWNTQVAGMNAIRIERVCCSWPENQTLLVLKDNFLFTIMYPDIRDDDSNEQKYEDFRKIFDKILSTFKFTDQNTTSTTPTPDPTANWKSYSNSAYSIMYPPEWKIANASETGISFESPDYKDDGGLPIITAGYRASVSLNQNCNAVYTFNEGESDEQAGSATWLKKTTTIYKRDNGPLITYLLLSGSQTHDACFTIIFPKNNASNQYATNKKQIFEVANTLVIK